MGHILARKAALSKAMRIVTADPEGWRTAESALRAGSLVVFPTDTVYGIGCDPNNVASILGIYEAKGRSFQKALPLLLSSASRISDVASDLPAAARTLGEAFWPGALTLVVPRNRSLPAELGGGETIAVRVPNFEGLQTMIAACGGAIAATSANISGYREALSAQEAVGYFGASVEVIVDGGPVSGGVPSTVVDCVVDPPAILREGAITREQITMALASRESKEGV